MRAVTFNIQHGAGGDAEALGRACAGLDADILALQEVDVRVPRSRLVDQVAVVAQATGMHAVFGRTCRVGVVGRYGNALLSRAPMREVSHLRLPRLGANEARGAVLARVGEVTVAATHLSIHEEEARAQLDAVVSALDRRPRPWLLLGDLNLVPEQLPSGLPIALADPAVPTFPAHGPRARIDHVAVDGLSIEAVEVLPQQPVSDHRPLAVRLAR